MKTGILWPSLRKCKQLAYVHGRHRCTETPEGCYGISEGGARGRWARTPWDPPPHKSFVSSEKQCSLRRGLVWSWPQVSVWLYLVSICLGIGRETLGILRQAEFWRVLHSRSGKLRHVKAGRLRALSRV